MAIELEITRVLWDVGMAPEPILLVLESHLFSSFNVEMPPRVLKIALSQVTPEQRQQFFLDCCQRGNTEVLLEVWQTLNPEDWNRVQILGLEMACVHCQISVVQFLFEVMPLIMDPGKSVFLKEACQHGTRELVQYLFERPEIKAYLTLLGQDPTERRELFRQATYNSKPSVTQYVFKVLKFTPEEMNSDDYYILEYACSTGIISLVRKIMKQAGVKSQTWFRHPRLLQAICRNNRLKLLKHLVRSGVVKGNQVLAPDYPALCSGLHYGHVTLVQYLIITFKIPLSNLRTIITEAAKIACETGQLLMLQYLVELGLNSSQIRSNSNEALMVACEYGHLDIVKYLTAPCSPTKNWRLEIRDVRQAHFDKAKWNPLHAACANGHLEIIQHLVTMGLSLEDIRSNHNLALYNASAGGHLNVVRYLVDLGLGLEDIRSLNFRALRMAHRNGNHDVVDYLVTTFNLSRAGILD